MANEKIASKGVGFYANMAANPGTAGYENNPDWQLVVCTTSKGFTGDKAMVDTASDCDGDWGSSAAGTKTWTFNNSFFAAKNVEDGAISHVSILGLWKEDIPRQFKLESIDDSGSTFYIMGYGHVQNVTLTGETGNYITGTMTVNGDGEFEDEIGS